MKNKRCEGNHFWKKVLPSRSLSKNFHCKELLESVQNIRKTVGIMVKNLVVMRVDETERKLSP